jgi:hypothetical protein
MANIKKEGQTISFCGVKKEGQTISFCGVNAHFQNRVAEQQIRDLSDGAKMSLLHAKEWWSSAVSVNLWPYAIRYRYDVYNSTHKEPQKASPVKLFSNMTIRPRLKHFHAFGTVWIASCKGVKVSKNGNSILRQLYTLVDHPNTPAQ